MIATLAEAGSLLGRPDWIDAAEQAAEFLRLELRRPDGRWWRSWHVGGEPKARHDALAADHACLVDAFTRLGEATGAAHWVDEARSVADTMLEHFWDGDNGGLFTTPGRRRGARRPAEGPLRQRHAVGQLDRCRRPRPPGRADRRDAATQRTPTRILRLVGAVVDQAPTAFSHALAAAALKRAGHHRGRRRRRPPGPRRGRQRAVAAERRAGVGGTVRVTAVGVARRRPGIRVPRLRLPGTAGHAGSACDAQLG